MTSQETALDILKKAVRKADSASALEFLRTGGSKPVILCDNSGSMYDHDEQELSRHERLNQELSVILERVDATVVAFNDTVQLSVVPLPQPSGGTDMAGAIQFACGLHPSQIVIISDGIPDSRERTTAAAQLLATTRIDVIFVGDPNDTDAREYLSSLASHSGLALTSGRDLTIAGQLANKVIGILTDGTETHGPIAL